MWYGTRCGHAARGSIDAQWNHDKSEINIKKEEKRKVTHQAESNGPTRASLRDAAYGWTDGLGLNQAHSIFPQSAFCPFSSIGLFLACDGDRLSLQLLLANSSFAALGTMQVTAGEIASGISSGSIDRATRGPLP